MNESPRSSPSPDDAPKGEPEGGSGAAAIDTGPADGHDPNKMPASRMWLFALGGALLGAVLGFYTPGLLGFVLGAAIFIAAGWASVHQTTASVGRGILGAFVGAMLAGVIGFVLWKMAASSAIANSTFDEAVMNAQTRDGAKLTPEQRAQMAELAKTTGSLVTGGLASFFVWLKAFVMGVVGAAIGGSTKKSA